MELLAEEGSRVTQTAYEVGFVARGCIPKQRG